MRETKYNNNGGHLNGLLTESRPAYLYKYLLSKIVWEIKGNERVYSLIIENDNPFLICPDNDTIQDIIDDFNAIVPSDEVVNALDPVPPPVSVFPPYVPPVVVQNVLPVIEFPFNNFTEFYNQISQYVENVPARFVNGLGYGLMNASRQDDTIYVYLKRRSDPAIKIIAQMSYEGNFENVKFKFNMVLPNWDVTETGLNDFYLQSEVFITGRPDYDILALQKDVTVFRPGYVPPVVVVPAINANIFPISKSFDFQLFPIAQPGVTLSSSSGGYFDLKFKIKNQAGQVLETLTEGIYQGFDNILKTTSGVSYSYDWLVNQAKQRFPYQTLNFELWVETLRNGVALSSDHLTDVYAYVEPAPVLLNSFDIASKKAKISLQGDVCTFPLIDMDNATGAQIAAKSLFHPTINGVSQVGLNSTIVVRSLPNLVVNGQSVEIIDDVSQLYEDAVAIAKCDGYLHVEYSCGYLESAYTDHIGDDSYYTWLGVNDNFDIPYVKPVVTPVGPDGWLLNSVDLSGSLKYDALGMACMPTNSEIWNAYNAIKVKCPRVQNALTIDQNFVWCFTSEYPLDCYPVIMRLRTRAYGNQLTYDNWKNIETEYLDNLIIKLNAGKDPRISDVSGHGYKPFSWIPYQISTYDKGYSPNRVELESLNHKGLNTAVIIVNIPEKVVSCMFFELKQKESLI